MVGWSLINIVQWKWRNLSCTSWRRGVAPGEGLPHRRGVEESWPFSSALVTLHEHLNPIYLAWTKETRGVRENNKHGDLSLTKLDEVTQKAVKIWLGRLHEPYNEVKIRVLGEKNVMKDEETWVVMMNWHKYFLLLVA